MRFVRRLVLVGVATATTSCSTAHVRTESAEWTTPDTPGAALAITEVARSGSRFDTVVTYILASQGLPAGGGYRLAIRRTAGPPTVAVEDAVVATSGQVESETPETERTAPIEIVAKSVVPGEPIAIRVLAVSGSAQATAEVVPRPLASDETAECYLSARFEHHSKNGYRVLLSGFETAEPVRVSITNSAGVFESAELTSPRSAFLPTSRLLEEPTTLRIVAASRSCRAEAVADLTDIPF
jgi:hypothetical protein